MIELVIVDDHTLFREGLASIIQMEPDIEVSGLAGSVQEAVDVVRKLKPDMVLMDFTLPDGTGADATRLILNEQPDCQIIFLTISESDENLYSAIRSGAKGYLLKNMSPSKLVSSLRRVIDGEAALSRKMTLSLIDRIADQDKSGFSDQMHPALKQLTSREMEVLEEIVKDASNKEIALRLRISVNTVKNHISSILSKLELNNRREAATLARRYNIGTNR
jgi:DNA-binding NarL/FixJ family response regulator